MKKQVRITEYSFLGTLWCESEFNKHFISVPSMHTVVFQPTSLITGIYGPPSTAKVLHIAKFLTDVLHTWCLDTCNNVTNCSEKNNFTLN